MYTFILVFAHIFICIYGTRKYVCTDVFMKLAYYIISHQRGDWDMDRETTHDSAIGDASVSQIGILLWSYMIMTILSIHPWRLAWNIIIGVWKIIFLSKWVICMFHVNLPGCSNNRIGTDKIWKVSSQALPDWPRFRSCWRKFIQPPLALLVGGSKRLLEGKKKNTGQLYTLIAK